MYDTRKFFKLVESKTNKPKKSVIKPSTIGFMPSFILLATASIINIILKDELYNSILWTFKFQNMSRQFKVGLSDILERLYTSTAFINSDLNLN